MREDAKDPAVLRRILLGQGISSIGDGIWFTTWAIYLTEVVGFSAPVMGLGIAMAGVAGIGLAYPGGHAADRFGARNTLVALSVVRGLAMLGFCFIQDLPFFLLVAIAFFGTQSAASGVRTALVCELFGEPDQLDVLARTRVVQHIAYAVGSGLGGLVLAGGEAWMFLLAITANAGTFAALAAVTAMLPRRLPHDAVRPDLRFSALRDLPYAMTMLVTAVLALCWALLSTGVPLWISNRTQAPTWLSAVIVVMCSLLIAIFQVRVTRRVRDVRLAARAGLLSGMLLAVCCGLFALSGEVSTGPAILVLLLAGLALVAGELYFVASRWGLAIGLMDSRFKGQYQGVAATGEATVLSVGPALVSLAVTAPSFTGWLALAVLFALVGAVTPDLVRWAVRD